MGLRQLFGIGTAKGRLAPESPQRVPGKPRPPSAVAQLVGASAISSLFEPTVGLDSSLLDLLEAGPDGPAPVRVRSIGGGGGEYHTRGRYRFDGNYVRELTTSFSGAMNGHGAEKETFQPFLWNGGLGNTGLIVVSGFEAERTEDDAQEIWRKAWQGCGLNSPAIIHLASGDGGWTTLEAAWNMITKHEAKVIWLATTDSPSYPPAEEPNEAAVLLMVAHPAVDTGREPLAYFSAPQVVPVKGAKRAEGETQRIAALRDSVERVCAAASIEPKAITSLATDCGRATPAASKRLGEVGAALHELMPEVDVVPDRIDMAALLGELGANTVNYTLLLAAYAAHQRNHPVLYLSNVDPDTARAMLVFPPRDHTPPDPHRPFRERHARGQSYAPWWGQRLDGKTDS